MVFNEKKNPGPRAKRRGSTFHESAVTILTPGCHFNGKLYCKGSSRIGGKIEGEIVSQGLLIIEEEAIITAEIKAEEAVIQGQVQGKVEATTRVELSSSSRFDGDVVTPSLVINEGAIFNGNTSMKPPEKEEQAVKPIPVVEKPGRKDFKGKPGPKIKMPEIGVS